MVESNLKCHHRLVDVLAGLFGLGAWLCVNAMFTQLPILVETAPEGWNLPSYLSILIQMANIGPILYSLMKNYAPHAISDSVLITFIMLLGTVSLLLMSFFYFQTSVILGESHSVPLFILTFCIALVGCTSSVLFIPYMNNYPEIHLVSYLVGEGLSGFIPSIVSFVQGVGIMKCVNKTENGTTSSYPEMSPPLFSSQLFFIIMFFLMCLSTIAFLFLNKLPSCKSVRLRKKSESVARSSIVDATADNNSIHLDKTISTSNATTISSSLFVTLLVLQTAVSMFANGTLPSIQSYSCLPYGNFAYHLAVNLANMANPVACFVAFFLPRYSIKCLAVLTVLTTITIVYNVTTASLSPYPPLQHQVSGIAIIVASWVACCGLISYIKLTIAAIFRREGGRGLYWYGVGTQVGALVGSLVTFYVVNFLNVFKSYDPCQS